MQFLFRPRIKKEESLVGYIERIVNINRYMNNMKIFSLLKSSPRDLQNNFFDIEDTIVLEQLTDEASDLLFSRSYIKVKELHENIEKYILKNKIKYCPQCVKDNGIHMFKWGFHPVCVCLEHQTILRECCPECMKNSTLFELLQSGICGKCGYQLITNGEDILKLSANYISSQVLIQNWIFEENYDCKEIGLDKFFSLAEISFHILEGMQSFIDEDHKLISAFSNKKDGDINNQKNLVAWGNYIWMYDNFPINFYQVLNEFSNKNKKTMYEQKGKYEQGLINNEFTLIKIAYEQFWIEKIDEGTIRKDFSVFKNNEDLLRKRTTIRREEAKKKTGMCYEKMISLQSIGRLEMKLDFKKGQHRFTINQNSLNTLIEDKRRYISKYDAAKILGITRDSVTHLINEKILMGIATPYTGHLMIQKSDVDNLLLECTGSYQRSFQGLSFHNALIKYSVIGLKIVDLIRFTREGLIHPKRRSFKGSLADVLYSEYELEKCIEKLKKERHQVKGYYFCEVMKILHIGEKRLKMLLKNKGIVPDVTIEFKDGRKRYLFTQEKIEQIKRVLTE